MESKVSVDAGGLRRYSGSDALSFADEILGPPSTWSPSLIEYRLSSDSQAAWKVEVGNWLLLARDQGFLPRLLSRAARARHEASNPSVTGPNDSAHRILAQELAPVMAAYYFVGLGWRFVEWEPVTEVGDVDVRLEAPSGITVDIQVKAPDQPGELAGGRVVDGEYDGRVLRAIDKAMGQLAAAPSPARMVVVSPQRTWTIEADVLACHLLGNAVIGGDTDWGIDPGGSGAFARSPGSIISAVVDLHLLLGLDETLYRCTVVQNPWILQSGILTKECFSHARVLTVQGDTFVWVPEQPSRCFRFPTGMRYLPKRDGA